MSMRGPGNGQACFRLSLTFFILFLGVSFVVADLDKLRSLKQKCHPASYCTLLLGRNGKIGCSQCGANSIAGSIRRFESKKDLEQFAASNSEDKQVVLLPQSLFVQDGVRQILKMAEKSVASVIVTEEDKDFMPESFSTERKIPNFNYTNYDIARVEGRYNSEFGDESAFVHYPFRIFQVRKKVTDELLKQSRRYGDLGVDNGYPRFKAESRGESWSCEHDNAKECLESRKCHPIGGRSIWAASQGFNTSNSEVFAVTAPMDSSAFFHDLAFGVSSEIASLAVLMTVVEAIGSYTATGSNIGRRNLAFFAFNTETWGYSGSGRFLKDVAEFTCEREAENSKENESLGGACTFPPMDSRRFEIFKGKQFSVLSIDQVGRLNKTSDGIYLHRNTNAESDLGSLLSDEFIESDTLPLTAVNSFANYARATDNFAISDYLQTFRNPFYHSQFDKLNRTLPFQYNVLNALAVKITKVILRHALDDEEQDPAKLINSGTTKEFVECLAGKGPWRDCKLVKEYLPASSVEGKARLATNYPGIYVPSSVRNATRLDGVESATTKEDLVKAFMAYHTRIRIRTQDRKPKDFERKCKYREECFGLRDAILESDGNSEIRAKNVDCVKAKCIITDTFFHDAFGPGLKRNDVDNKEFRVVDDSQSGRPQEAAWTESFWDPIELCTYTEDSTGFGLGILFAGLLVFAASIIITVTLNLFLFAEPKAPENNGEDVPNTDETVNSAGEQIAAALNQSVGPIITT